MALCYIALPFAVLGLGFVSLAPAARANEARKASPANEPAVRAQLTPRRHAVLSAEVAARVRQFHVKEGATFAAGDALVTFEDAVPRALLARAEATLTSAERTYAANQRLHTLNSIGQIELELSAAELAKARADHSLATTQVSRCSIIAPFTGRMAVQHVQPEEFTQIGSRALRDHRLRASADRFHRAL
jgi:membrane fusion protein, multidrug efflux system